MDIVGKSKEDVSLPKSTMFKIIKEMLPPDVRVARDTQDLLVECCVEFINLLSSESNDVCSREEKKTIAPEHVIRALQDLGFKEYIEEVYAAYEQHKLDTLDSPKASKFTGVEMSEEEAVAEQQRMFAEARARMNNGATKPKESELEPHKQSQLSLQPQVQMYPQAQKPPQPQVQLYPQAQQPPEPQVQLHSQPLHPLQPQVQLHPQPQQLLQPQMQLHPQAQQQQPPQPQLQPQQLMQPLHLHPQTQLQRLPEPQPQVHPQPMQPQLQLHPQPQPQQSLQTQLQRHMQSQQPAPLPLQPPQSQRQLHPQPDLPTQVPEQPQPQPELLSDRQTEHGLDSS